MLDVKTIARVLGTTEAKVKKAIRATGVTGSIGDRSRRAYYGSDAIDRIKAHLGL
jgi:hypothetical protein